MPKKTKKEYETVEKEIEYTECDVPGCLNTDEEKELIELAVNPRYTVKETKEPTVVYECGDYKQAEGWVYEQKKKLRDDTLSNGLDDSVSYHGGYTFYTDTAHAKSDASFFVCQDCLKNHFEAVPDRYDPDKVTNIENDADYGKLRITQEINPMFSIPDGLMIALVALNFLIMTLTFFLL